MSDSSDIGASGCFQCQAMAQSLARFQTDNASAWILPKMPSYGSAKDGCPDICGSSQVWRAIPMYQKFVMAGDER